MISLAFSIAIAIVIVAIFFAFWWLWLGLFVIGVLLLLLCNAPQVLLVPVGVLIAIGLLCYLLRWFSNAVLRRSIARRHRAAYAAG